MRAVFGYIIMSLIAIQAVFSQKTVRLNLQNDSYLSIKGSSNVLPFSLHQQGDKFLTNNKTFTAFQNQNKLIFNQSQLAIGVENFSSDNSMALRDFKKLMKSDIYPNLQIQIQQIELLPNALNSKLLKGTALVAITITGVTKQYLIPISSNNKGEITIIDGKKNINIRDFGLTPPEELLGLVKVSEWININFRLNCKISIQEQEISYYKESSK